MSAWCRLLIVLAVFSGDSSAQQVYLCQNKVGGPSSYQDSPCASGKGGPIGIQAGPGNYQSSPRDDTLAQRTSDLADQMRADRLKSEAEARGPNGGFSVIGRGGTYSPKESPTRARLEALGAQPGKLTIHQAQVLQALREQDQQSGCSRTQILKPIPFLGTANEEIYLADGSVWKDLSYKYLYLYAYNPMVLICPGQGKMILDAGGQKHTFSLMRLK